MTSTLGEAAEKLVSVEQVTVEEAEAAVTRLAEKAGQQAVASSLADPVGLRKKWVRRYGFLLVCADLAAAVAAVSAAYAVKPLISHDIIARGYLGQHASYPRLAALSVLAWLAMQGLSGAYRGKHVAADDRDYRVPARSALRLIAAVALSSYLFHVEVSRVMLGAFFCTLLVGMVVCRSVVNLALRHARARGRAKARVLVVGEKRSVAEFADHLLSRPDHRFDIVAVCTRGTDRGLNIRDHVLPVAGAPDEVLDAVGQVSADTVVMANPSGLEFMTLQQVAWQLERSGVDLLVAPDTVALAGPRLKVSSLRGLPVLQVSHPQHESLLRTVHFAASRVAAALLLAVASPILLAVVLTIKLGSAGPVFYRQKRIGYKGQEFDMIKFRSMEPNADALLPKLIELNEHDGPLFKMKDDPRITSVGRVLRKYSLDELPQLINVVRGEMALVGPRPCLPREMTMFGEAEHRRFMVKPGMTGLWQVSGGPSLTWSDAVKTDLYYVDNWSPVLDATILARTLRVVLAGSGY